MTTARTWNLKLTATDRHPEATLEGVPHEAATRILRGLMYGPDSPEYTHVERAVATARRMDRHEGSLAA